MRHIRMTFPPASPGVMLALAFEVFYDGAVEPSISLPALDFFGMPLGRPVDYSSVLTSAQDGRGFNAFFPLPIRGGARFELADRKIDAETARLMSYQVAWMQNAGLVPNKEASVAKLFSGELEQRIARTGLKALGLYGLRWGPEASVRGQLSRMYAASVSMTSAAAPPRFNAASSPCAGWECLANRAGDDSGAIAEPLRNGSERK